jgi:hypothetical protein
MITCSNSLSREWDAHSGAKVRIRIAHGSAKFTALGRVSYTTPDAGMGIVFTQIEPNDQLVLEKWVEGLRDLD